MKLKLAGTLLLLVTMVSQSLSSTALIASNITYKRTDSLVYEVSLIAYRYCGGIAFPGTYNLVVTDTAGRAKETITLTRSSITPVTPICKTAKEPCSPANTSTGGDGLERHVYTATVDFTSGQFSTFTKASHPVIFEYGACCRNSAITTGAANKNYYNYAYLDLADEVKASPQFKTDPIGFACCQQPVRYTLGAVRNVGNDSVTIRVVEPLSGYNKPITMSVPPVSAYYPGSTKYPYSKPDANPPIGYFVDKETGDVVFTPTNCSETTVLVFEVTTWRKDSSGKYHVSSVVRRDELLVVQKCPENNPPEIKGTSTFEVCEQENLTFTLTTSDKVVVPPPPKPTPDPDTVRLSLVNPIDRIKFTFTPDTVINQSVTVSWTPTPGKARSQPYIFSVKARDNACPLNAVVYKTVKIYVRPKAKATISVTEKTCNIYHLKASLDSNFALPAKYLWEILDAKGQPVGTDVAYFTSSNEASAKVASDSIYIRKTGTYVARLTLDNPHGCSRVYEDTIKVGSDIKSLFSKEELIICSGDSIALKQDLHQDSIFSSYQWSNDSTTATVYVTPKSADHIFLRANLKSGCFYLDGVRLPKSQGPDFTLKAKSGYCKPINDTLTIQLANRRDFDKDSVWWNGTLGDDTLIISSDGQYRVRVKNHCGSREDTVDVAEWSKPVLDLSVNPSFFCDIRKLTLQSGIKNRSPKSIFWWDHYPPKETLSVTQFGTYVLRAENACGSTKDSINIKGFYKSPSVDLGGDTFVCDFKSITLDATFDQATYDWSTGANTPSITVTSEGVIGVEVETPCGIAGDTIDVGRKHSPKREMPSDTFYCEGDDFYLDAGNEGATYSWNGNGEKTRKLKIDSANTYTVFITSECGSASISTKVEERYPPVVDLGADSVTGTGSMDLNAGNPGSTYAWSSGDKTQRVTVSKPGWYWVDVSNSCGTTRDSIHIQFTNVEELEARGISLFPNPSKGQVTISFSNLSELRQITVYDAVGKEIEVNQYHRSNGEVLLDFSRQKGYYKVVLQMDDGMISAPVLILSE
ncbi:MAG: T9SS type A sorting domain-containing protein [Bacteroidia bacterium]|nr:T9SS type A sorting domain-containing protein [Bacteroidia bacterium]